MGAVARLNGKVGAAFASTATQHGGQETTLFSIITNLLHFGMVIVGMDYGLRTANDAGGDRRRVALWRHDHRRRRRIASACHRRNWMAPATRAGAWPRLPPSCMVERLAGLGGQDLIHVTELA